MHPIRKTIANEEMKEIFEAILDIDETYVGWKPRKDNTPNDNDKENNDNKRGGGTTKTPVTGVKERSTGKVHSGCS
jgi:hypothetical protein